MSANPFIHSRFDTGCTVEVEHTAEFLHAHVALDGNLEMLPGDKVLVHGQPIQVEFGKKLSERRTATVERAGWLKRSLTKLLARLEIRELFEVSFSERRTL